MIDAGTSAMRAVTVSADGTVTAVASEPYDVFVPEDAAPFGREFDPKSLLRALNRLINAASARTVDIAAIAFTGQREGIAFTDAGGAAIFASPNVDARAASQGMAIDAARGSEVYATTGHLPSLMQAPAKLAWLRSERPETASRVRHVVPVADWLAAALAGSMAMSRSLAAENGLLDVRTCAVPEALLGALGLALSLLPGVADDGAVAGVVERGELRGVPVLLAGADTQCALLGMGALEAGDTAVPAGWSAPVQMVTAAPVFDDAWRTWTSVHVTPGAWILESNAGETGRSWEWLCSMLGMQSEAATALASNSPAGARDVVCIYGPRAMRAGAMSAGLGALTFPLPLVMSEPDRGDVLRATLEAIAYAVRANIEQLEEVSGATIGRLALGGGMSRNMLFAQILADVIDRPVTVAGAAETTAVGAAMLAAATVGLHSSLAESVASMRRASAMIEPKPAVSAVYEDAYGRWCALADSSAQLAAEAG
ncbi:MAG TPA: FGGY-family carbohydrate kinase [Dehalococcoidia bacterium]|nr:FGGY-family carbohydrate kinase [Dehalococcoidia bacterium]